MSWLSNRLGIHLNLRPLAPIAGAVVGNALLPGLGGMALGSAFGSGADDLGNGGNIGSALKKAAISGGLTYGGGKALGVLRGKFAPGSGATIPGGEVGSAVPASPFGDAAKDAALSSGAPEASGGLTGALKAIGGFAKDNPTATGMGLQGLGGMAQAGSQNALARAQADQVAAQTRAIEEEQEERKRRGLAMEPLLRALMGNMARPVSANPYS